jgi:hypothetical protein
MAQQYPAHLRGCRTHSWIRRALTVLGLCQVYHAKLDQLLTVPVPSAMPAHEVVTPTGVCNGITG